MALNDAALNAAASTLSAELAHGQLFTGAPNASGTSNLTSAGRQPLVWNAAANGDLTLTTDVNFTGGAASGACTHIGFFDQATDGNFYGYTALTGDQAFNASGEYTVTDITITGTAG